MKSLGKFSFGVGDRFGEEGQAQLRALQRIKEEGVEVTPVWNKSHREHQTVNTKPDQVRQEADKAVEALKFQGGYFVDADHINLETVAPYLSVSDFFTIDVADSIGVESATEDREQFLRFMEKFPALSDIPAIPTVHALSEQAMNSMINSFLFAAKKASEVYRVIAENKVGDFVVEVSMDEVERPQTPVELLFVLAALSFYRVPVNTIAPKFTGRFNKGVDYEGDLQIFRKEFEEDLLVLDYAKGVFNLPKDLKLSIHSGSDKFSIYPIMKQLVRKHNAGLHVKTAGTTWLEEITVLSESGEDGFKFALSVYEEALERFDELISPYPDVLDIRKTELPSVPVIEKEGGANFARALRHNKEEENYNPNLRQLMHCAYKISAERGEEFYSLLKKYRTPIENAVTQNLFDKHLLPLFNEEN